MSGMHDRSGPMDYPQAPGNHRPDRFLAQRRDAGRDFGRQGREVRVARDLAEITTATAATARTGKRLTQFRP
jgi:hypothetical protein